MASNPPYQAPLNGNDAVAILRIVWGWIENTGATPEDVRNLRDELTTNGYDSEWTGMCMVADPLHLEKD